MPFHQIGTEGGLLPTTVKQYGLLVGNGERADVILDFTGLAAGTTLVMKNDAATPFDPSQPPLDSSDPCTDVMQFRVVAATGPDRSALPAHPKKVTRLPEVSATKHRNITLVEAPHGNSGYMKVLVNGREFMGPQGPLITETPQLGSTEVWSYINLTPDTHPMHMHLVHFQVLDRQKFDVAKYKAAYGGLPAPEGSTLFTAGSRIRVDPNGDEAAWKDTAKMHPGEITRVIARFEHFTGKFVYHCHILDHEENDMMQYFQVMPPPGMKVDENGEVQGEVAERAGEQSLPERFSLEQNYPNPFNPSTMIQFALPTDEAVTMKVFNAVGQEVATLINGPMPAGTHSIVWNASQFPSGMYFATIRAGNFSASRKMLMVK